MRFKNEKVRENEKKRKWEKERESSKESNVYRLALNQYHNTVVEHPVQDGDCELTMQVLNQTYVYWNISISGISDRRGIKRRNTKFKSKQKPNQTINTTAKYPKTENIKKWDYNMWGCETRAYKNHHHTWYSPCDRPLPDLLLTNRLDSERERVSLLASPWWWWWGWGWWSWWWWWWEWSLEGWWGESLGLPPLPPAPALRDPPPELLLLFRLNGLRSLPPRWRMSKNLIDLNRNHSQSEENHWQR